MKQKHDIEFLGVERIREGNLLEFDVDNGNMHFTIVQSDEDFSIMTDVLNIFAS